MTAGGCDHECDDTANRWPRPGRVLAPLQVTVCRQAQPTEGEPGAHVSGPILSYFAISFGSEKFRSADPEGKRSAKVCVQISRTQIDPRADEPLCSRAATKSRAAPFSPPRFRGRYEEVPPPPGDHRSPPCPGAIARWRRPRLPARRLRVTVRPPPGGRFPPPSAAAEIRVRWRR